MILCARLGLLSMVLGVVTIVGGASPSAAFTDKDCGDFSTQAEAQDFFEKNDPANDPHSLDADGDGIACETLPCPCSTGSGGGDTTTKQQAKILEVIDGDTVKVKLGNGSKKKVRMIGIDTPEQGQCGYKKAKRKLNKFTPRGTKVKLVSDSTQTNKDRHGRLLRYVHKGTTDANKRQVAKGMATVYVYDNAPFKRVKKYKKAQRSAKNNDRGLWGTCW